MQIIAVSDTHGDISAVRAAVSKHCADMLIHAGDVERDVDKLRYEFPKLEIEAVRGNNEFGMCDSPLDRVITVCGKKIFITHGHKYGVKSGLMRVSLRAAELGADICIFGHTHRKHVEYLKDMDIWLVNPGSASGRYGGASFAVIEIDDGTIKIKTEEVE